MKRIRWILPLALLLLAASAIAGVAQPHLGPSATPTTGTTITVTGKGAWSSFDKRLAPPPEVLEKLDPPPPEET